ASCRQAPRTTPARTAGAGACPPLPRRRTAGAAGELHALVRARRPGLLRSPAGGPRSAGPALQRAGGLIAGGGQNLTIVAFHVPEILVLGANSAAMKNI